MNSDHPVVRRFCSPKTSLQVGHDTYLNPDPNPYTILSLPLLYPDHDPNPNSNTNPYPNPDPTKNVILTFKRLAMVFAGQENPLIIFRSKEICIYFKTNNKIPINLLDFWQVSYLRAL